MEVTVGISCWFGERFIKPTNGNLFATTKYHIKNALNFRLYRLLKVNSVVPRKPKNIERCIFFSNNTALESEARDKGWEFHFYDGKLDNIESIASSMLAKKIKFLQFDQHNELGLLNVDNILYMDSRRITDDIDKLLAVTSDIGIRYTPRSKTLWDEVDEAMEQTRYAKNMPETIDYINNLITNGLDVKQQVMNTGVILYRFKSPTNKSRILSLCKKVYDNCVQLEQPECQIIWYAESQSYDDLITKVDYDFINERNY